MEVLELLAAQWPAIVCFIAGIALVTLEMFIPGFGLPGIAGGLLLIGAIALAASNLTQALLLALGTIAVLALIFVLAMRSATRGKLAKSPLVLNESATSESGYTSNEDAKALIGSCGIACTELRPAGVAEIEGKRYDVVADGQFLPRGTTVQVVEVAGRRISVSAMPEQEVEEPEGFANKE